MLASEAGTYFLRNDGIESLDRSGRSTNGAPDRAGELCIPQTHTAIQGMRMTLGQFIEAKFIPEHVVLKTRAGQTHYQALLKHLITPELVSRVFRSGPLATTRMRAVPEWPYLDEVRLCDLTADHVRRLIDAAGAAGYASQTVTHIKNVLFAVISHAQREGCFLGPNPARLVKLPKPAPRIQLNLTFQETKAVLEHLEYPAKAIAIFTITTGMTLNEICELEWKYVNLGNAVRYVDGEPLPALSVAVRGQSNTRIIEISEPLHSTLRHLSGLNAHPKTENRFVISSRNSRVSDSCTSDLKEVGKALGIPWITWQVLRAARTAIIEEFLRPLSAPQRIDTASTKAGGGKSVEVLRGYGSLQTRRSLVAAFRRTMPAPKQKSA